MCSSFSATATVNDHQALSQWEGDVEGRLHQQCPDQDWGGVVRQRSDTTVLPSQEVSIKYHNCISGVINFYVFIFLTFFSIVFLPAPEQLISRAPSPPLWPFLTPSWELPSPWLPNESQGKSSMLAWVKHTIHICLNIKRKHLLFVFLWHRTV